MRQFLDNTTQYHICGAKIVSFLYPAKWSLFRLTLSYCWVVCKTHSPGTGVSYWQGGCKRHTELLLITVIVGIPCDEKNFKENECECNLFTNGAPRSSKNSFKRSRAFPDRIGIWICWLERGKPEYPEKNLSEQSREPTTNSTHI